ncbi:hypothetical protein FA95DRAFT_662337 [Auriscalpium vulgare]|uniref:Uncharacterized protein n=1 Tax=Auriscalpium vulgare TaxID=40419 RepID=A0ACB8S2C9_9AGAM|nr:hypothetical protein FA95DRAFT_662337 [Auriscalpium vulgare]
MGLSTSPRKVVPLSTGDEWEGPSKSAVGSVTRRVFFCGVVVENDGGRELPDDVRELVASLGEPLGSYSDEGEVSQPEIRNSRTDTDGKSRRRAMTDTSAIQDIINELVDTERSYVSRLKILKKNYADPLRSFATRKESMIIPAYEANTLFGNIDNIIPVNEALLADLEKMVAPDGPRMVGYIGDVMLRHFRDLRGFDVYKQFYVKREEAQMIFEREMSKKSSGFEEYTERVKYDTSDVRNRVGLRELLMDPVQRIPRYTLLFRTMIKRMAPTDPQRAKLIEADDIASKIALAEADEETKRATIMYCLGATVEDFPPALISHSRRFIDCIDVEDEGPPPLEPLQCSLFLFDDKLMIVKRPKGSDKGCRILAGLDQLDKVAKGGRLPSGMKKSGMSCKGVVDIADVVATDVGGPDIHLYLESPPHGQTDRWSGRPFRALSVVFPPAPPNFNPQRTDVEKSRFLENLWKAQATLRTRGGSSVVLRAEEREVESRAGRTTYARTYFNVYQRTAFLREPKKPKVVVQIDSLGSSDPIPFGMHGPPFVSIRIQPIAGELSRYTVTSSDPSDEQEEDIMQTSRVPSRIVHTIHQFGLFKFKTGKNSAPSTPSATTRSRAAMFGLDAISRNLFGALPGGSKGGDVFGNSMNGSRRTKSSTRSSVYTSNSDGSLMRFSQRSVSTAATSVEDESFSGSRSSSRSRKLLKRRSKSPKSGEEPDSASPQRPHSRSGSRSQTVSRETSPSPFDDSGDVDASLAQPTKSMDQSEWDLTQRLELARRNSQQHGKGPLPAVPSWEAPIEETIYEEMPPLPLRPSSRASKDTYSQRSTTPTNRPPSTTPTREQDSPEPYDRPVSRASSSGHPRGPRSSSPGLPSPRLDFRLDSPLMELETALETTLVNVSRLLTPGRDISPLPRSKRQPFDPTGNMDETPRTAFGSPSKAQTAVEPLSIKKKASVRNAPGDAPAAGRKVFTKTSPLSKGRVVSPRRVSPLVRHAKASSSTMSAVQPVDTDRILRLAESTKEDLESSRRAVKRIKMDVEHLRSSSSYAEAEERLPHTPRLGGLPRTPQRNTPAMTRAAQDRLEEMRQLIGKRNGEVTPRSRTRSAVDTPPLGHDKPRPDEAVQLVEESASEADKALLRAASTQDALGVDLALLAADLKEKATLLEKARLELQSTRRQCELVKNLLADATAENEIMYEAFNEELESMFNDAQLPEDRAWAAMAEDLRRTKASRNNLARENAQLKRRLAESESEKEEWGELLRQHGLIP